MESGKIMKIIFSRKGFDSSAGGCPSPILPDGRMISLPIPDKHSPIRYKDIRWQEYKLGSLVSELTGGRIPASHFAHLDPDLNRESFSRKSGWRPIFGQTGVAQGHLRKNRIQPGDIFLFFGLFRDVTNTSLNFEWNKRKRLRHVLWGWLQVDEILKVDNCPPSRYSWARYHPHFYTGLEKDNAIYIARRYLELPGIRKKKLSGAGTFLYFSEQLALTEKTSTKPSQWELPKWLYPRDGKSPLTYHSNMARWQLTKKGTKLSTVSRGQEFIFDTEKYPEAIGWVKNLLVINANSH
ncbi:MAG: hypothetical protein ACFFDN_37485 [Candidatus Hodarchaeota archaeon]